MKVCVVGAGIIGVTTAYRVLERFPRGILTLDLVADAFSPNTTSDVAAGFWEPYNCPGTSQDELDRWGGATFDLLSALWNDPDSVGLELSQLSKAVSLCPAYCFGKEEGKEEEEESTWKQKFINYQTMDETDVARFRGGKSENMVGETFSTYTLDSGVALPIFYKLLESKGATLTRRKIESMHDLSHYDYVFNCTGVGAADLVDDRSIEPTSGHVLRVWAPWINQAVIVDLEDGNISGPSYVIPNRESVVVGAINTPNNWSLRPLHPNDGARLLERCSKIIPSLRHAKILKERIGLRPVRKWGVRIELEMMEGPGIKVIHNYGHGGSGITLCWGCAKDATDLLEKSIKEQTRPSKL